MVKFSTFEPATNRWLHINIVFMTELQIPNQIGMLLVLQSFVEESAKVYHLPENMLQHLRLISEEAFLHILKNSFNPDELSTIKVVADVDDALFILSFFDKGLPFDGSLAKQYHPEADVNAVDTEGMELFLIKQFADKVEWVNHGSGGKEFRLSFELHQRDIITILNNKRPKDAEMVAIHADDIDIRPFKDSDAIKIARTIYRAYGYSYPNEDLYYPERITAQNRSGKLVSVVCHDKHRDEIVGHYALERPALGSVAESGQAVVSPGYRGFHLMNKMRVLLEKKTLELHLEGIMSQPVTTHVFSQRVNIGFGSFPCGFSFGLVPQKLSFRQISNTLSQRESCMFFFKPLAKRNRKLFIPPKHKSIIEKIYNNLGFDFTQGKKTQNAVSGANKVKSNYYAGWGFGVIEVTEPDTNTFDTIKKHFITFCLNLKRR